MNRRVEITPISEFEFNLLKEAKVIEAKPKVKTQQKVTLGKEKSESEKSIHIVKKKETLYSIAKLYSISLEQLLIDNELEKTSITSIGQQIKILINKNHYYKVQKEDTLYSIALKHQLTIDELKALNNLKSNLIFIGQELKISKQ